MYVYVPDVSTSVAERVPTSVPAAAVSDAEEALRAISVGELSFTSVIVIVTVSVTAAVPSEICTVRSNEVAVS